MREIGGVFGAYGISVDTRHLALVADFMTRSGAYQARVLGCLTERADTHTDSHTHTHTHAYMHTNAHTRIHTGV